MIGTTRIYEAQKASIAIEYACEDLGVSEGDLPVEKIVKRGGRAIFSRKLVEVTVRIESKLERMIIDFIERTLSYMNCSARAEVSDRANNQIWIQIKADHPAILIGKKGKTLDALQHLASVFSKRHTEEGLSVILDVRQYRHHQARHIEHMTRRIAKKVRSSGASHLLEPMNSYDRYIVHGTVRPLRGVTSQSEGKGVNRRVRILINER